MQLHDGLEGIVEVFLLSRLFFDLLPGSRIHHDDVCADSEARHRRPAHTAAQWEGAGGRRFGPLLPGAYQGGALCHAIGPMPAEPRVGLSFVQLRFSIARSKPRWIEPWRCTGWPCYFPRLLAVPGLANHQYTVSLKIF